MSGEFLVLSDKFYNATHRLIQSCKKCDTEIADAQFDKMIKSCEMYKESDNDNGNR